jgi:hypothetical protein
MTKDGLGKLVVGDTQSVSNSQNDSSYSSANSTNNNPQNNKLDHITSPLTFNNGKYSTDPKVMQELPIKTQQNATKFAEHLNNGGSINDFKTGLTSKKNELQQGISDNKELMENYERKKVGEELKLHDIEKTGNQIEINRQKKVIAGINNDYNELKTGNKQNEFKIKDIEKFENSGIIEDAKSHTFGWKTIKALKTTGKVGFFATIASMFIPNDTDAKNNIPPYSTNAANNLHSSTKSTPVSKSDSMYDSAKDWLSETAENLGMADLAANATQMTAELSSNKIVAAKTVAKVVGKITPGVGMAYGVTDTADRTLKEDYLGAALSTAIGGSSSLPYFGTALALGLTGVQMGTDYLGITGQDYSSNNNINQNVLNTNGTPLSQNISNGFLTNQLQTVQAAQNDPNLAPAIISHNTSKNMNTVSGVTTGQQKPIILQTAGGQVPIRANNLNGNTVVGNTTTQIPYNEFLSGMENFDQSQQQRFSELAAKTDIGGSKNGSSLEAMTKLEDLETNMQENINESFLNMETTMDDITDMIEELENGKGE